MNKKRFFLCLLIAVVILAAACAKETKEDASAGPPKDIDDTFVVATINGKPIYYSQYYTQFKNACSYYGISEDDEANSGFVKQMVLEGLVDTEIMYQAYTDKGYLDLTSEQLSKIEQDAQEEMKMIIKYYYSTDLTSELGEDYTQEQYDSVKDKYEEKALSEYGFSKEDLIKYYKTSLAQEAAMKELTGDIVPTEEQVRAKYDEEVAFAKESILEDPAYYENIVSEGMPVYYVPENVRNVRHILIKFEDEILQAIASLRNNGYDKAGDMLRESALAGIRDKAQEVLNKINSKEISFDDAIEEYNGDTAMPKEGYPIAGTAKIIELIGKIDSGELSITEALDAYKTYNDENEITPRMAEEFSFYAMALKSKGDITNLVGTDFGYHIIEYFSDAAAGAVSFDSVRQNIYDSLTEQLQQEKWDEITKEWKDSAVVEYTEDSF